MISKGPQQSANFASLDKKFAATIKFLISLANFQLGVDADALMSAAQACSELIEVGKKIFTEISFEQQQHLLLCLSATSNYIGKLEDAITARQLKGLYSNLADLTGLQVPLIDTIRDFFRSSKALQAHFLNAKLPKAQAETETRFKRIIGELQGQISKPEPYRSLMDVRLDSSKVDGKKAFGKVPRGAVFDPPLSGSGNNRKRSDPVESFEDPLGSLLSIQPHASSSSSSSSSSAFSFSTPLISTNASLASSISSSSSAVSSLSSAPVVTPSDLSRKAASKGVLSMWALPSSTSVSSRPLTESDIKELQEKLLAEIKRVSAELEAVKKDILQGLQARFNSDRYSEEKGYLDAKALVDDRFAMCEQTLKQRQEQIQTNVNAIVGPQFSNSEADFKKIVSENYDSIVDSLNSAKAVAEQTLRSGIASAVIEWIKILPFQLEYNTISYMLSHDVLASSLASGLVSLCSEMSIDDKDAQGVIGAVCKQADDAQTQGLEQLKKKFAQQKTVWEGEAKGNPYEWFNDLVAGKYPKRAEEWLNQTLEEIGNNALRSIFEKTLHILIWHATEKFVVQGKMLERFEKELNNYAIGYEQGKEIIDIAALSLQQVINDTLTGLCGHIKSQMADKIAKISAAQSSLSAFDREGWKKTLMGFMAEVKGELSKLPPESLLPFGTQIVPKLTDAAKMQQKDLFAKIDADFNVFLKECHGFRDKCLRVITDKQKTEFKRKTDLYLEALKKGGIKQFSKFAVQIGNPLELYARLSPAGGRENLLKQLHSECQKAANRFAEDVNKTAASMGFQLSSPTFSLIFPADNKNKRGASFAAFSSSSSSALSASTSQQASVIQPSLIGASMSTSASTSSVIAERIAGPTLLPTATARREPPSISGSFASASSSLVQVLSTSSISASTKKPKTAADSGAELICMQKDEFLLTIRDMKRDFRRKNMRIPPVNGLCGPDDQAIEKKTASATECKKQPIYCEALIAALRKKFPLLAADLKRLDGAGVKFEQPEKAKNRAQQEYLIANFLTQLETWIKSKKKITPAGLGSALSAIGFTVSDDKILKRLRGSIYLAYSFNSMFQSFFVEAMMRDQEIVFTTENSRPRKSTEEALVDVNNDNFFVLNKILQLILVGIDTNCNWDEKMCGDMKASDTTYDASLDVNDIIENFFDSHMAQLESSLPNVADPGAMESIRKRERTAFTKAERIVIFCNRFKLLVDNMKLVGRLEKVFGMLKQANMNPAPNQIDNIAQEILLDIFAAPISFQIIRRIIRPYIQELKEKSEQLLAIFKVSSEYLTSQAALVTANRDVLKQLISITWALTFAYEELVLLNGIYNGRGIFLDGQVQGLPMPLISTLFDVVAKKKNAPAYYPPDIRRDIEKLYISIGAICLVLQTGSPQLQLISEQLARISTTSEIKELQVEYEQRAKKTAEFSSKISITQQNLNLQLLPLYSFIHFRTSHAEDVNADPVSVSVSTSNLIPSKIAAPAVEPDLLSVQNARLERRFGTIVGLQGKTTPATDAYFTWLECIESELLQLMIAKHRSRVATSGGKLILFGAKSQLGTLTKKGVRKLQERGEAGEYGDVLPVGFKHVRQLSDEQITSINEKLARGEFNPQSLMRELAKKCGVFLYPLPGNISNTEYDINEMAVARARLILLERKLDSIEDVYVRSHLKTSFLRMASERLKEIPVYSWVQHQLKFMARSDVATTIQRLNTEVKAIKQYAVSDQIVAIAKYAVKESTIPQSLKQKIERLSPNECISSMIRIMMQDHSVNFMQLRSLLNQVGKEVSSTDSRNRVEALLEVKDGLGYYPYNSSEDLGYDFARLCSAMIFGSGATEALRWGYDEVRKAEQQRNTLLQQLEAKLQATPSSVRAGGRDAIKKFIADYDKFTKGRECKYQQRAEWLKALSDCRRLYGDEVIDTLQKIRKIDTEMKIVADKVNVIVTECKSPYGLEYASSDDRQKFGWLQGCEQEFPKTLHEKLGADAILLELDETETHLSEDHGADYYNTAGQVCLWQYKECEKMQKEVNVNVYKYLQEISLDGVQQLAAILDHYEAELKNSSSDLASLQSKLVTFTRQLDQAPHPQLSAALKNFMTLESSYLRAVQLSDDIKSTKTDEYTDVNWKKLVDTSAAAIRAIEAKLQPCRDILDRQKQVEAQKKDGKQFVAAVDALVKKFEQCQRAYAIEEARLSASSSSSASCSNQLSANVSGPLSEIGTKESKEEKSSMGSAGALSSALAMPTTQFLQALSSSSAGVAMLQTLMLPSAWQQTAQISDQQPDLLTGNPLASGSASLSTSSSAVSSVFLAAATTLTPSSSSSSATSAASSTRSASGSEEKKSQEEAKKQEQQIKNLRQSLVDSEKAVKSLLDSKNINSAQLDALMKHQKVLQQVLAGLETKSSAQSGKGASETGDTSSEATTSAEVKLEVGGDEKTILQQHKMANEILGALRGDSDGSWQAVSGLLDYIENLESALAILRSEKEDKKYQADEKRLRDNLAVVGRNLQDVGHQGNCAFEAIVAQCHELKITIPRPPTLPSAVTEPQLLRFLAAQRQQEVKFMVVADEDITQSRKWAEDSNTFLALTQVLNATICMIRSDQERPTVIKGPRDSSNIIYLSYHYPVHFASAAIDPSMDALLGIKEARRQLETDIAALSPGEISWQLPHKAEKKLGIAMLPPLVKTVSMSPSISDEKKPAIKMPRAFSAQDPSIVGAVSSAEEVKAELAERCVELITSEITSASRRFGRSSIEISDDTRQQIIAAVKTLVTEWDTLAIKAEISSRRVEQVLRSVIGRIIGVEESQITALVRLIKNAGYISRVSSPYLRFLLYYLNSTQPNFAIHKDAPEDINQAIAILNAAKAKIFNAKTEVFDATTFGPYEFVENAGDYSQQFQGWVKKIHSDYSLNSIQAALLADADLQAKFCKVAELARGGVKELKQVDVNVMQLFFVRLPLLEPPLKAVAHKQEELAKLAKEQIKVSEEKITAITGAISRSQESATVVSLFTALSTACEEFYKLQKQMETNDRIVQNAGLGLSDVVNLHENRRVLDSLGILNADWTKLLGARATVSEFYKEIVDAKKSLNAKLTALVQQLKKNKFAIDTISSELRTLTKKGFIEVSDDVLQPSDVTSSTSSSSSSLASVGSSSVFGSPFSSPAYSGGTLTISGGEFRPRVREPKPGEEKERAKVVADGVEAMAAALDQKKAETKKSLAKKHAEQVSEQNSAVSSSASSSSSVTPFSASILPKSTKDVSVLTSIAASTSSLSSASLSLMSSQAAASAMLSPLPPPAVATSSSSNSSALVLTALNAAAMQAEASAVSATNSSQTPAVASTTSSNALSQPRDAVLDQAIASATEVERRERSASVTLAVGTAALGYDASASVGSSSSTSSADSVTQPLLQPDTAALSTSTTASLTSPEAKQPTSMRLNLPGIGMRTYGYDTLKFLSGFGIDPIASSANAEESVSLLSGTSDSAENAGSDSSQEQASAPSGPDTHTS